MMMTTLLVILIIASALFVSESEACSRRRRRRRTRFIVFRPPPPPWQPNRPPRIPPPISQPVPRPPPTARPSNTPTAHPTPVPTRSPTPEPTPPPPPPPITGFFPTPDTPSTPFMGRSNCRKRVEFAFTGTGSETEIKEEWIYTCDYQMYVTVDMEPIEEPTPCACGLGVDTPPVPSNGIIGKEFFTDVRNVSLVVYDDKRNVVIKPIPGFVFEQNENTTKALFGSVQDGGRKGFAGIVQRFEPGPELDQTVMGQEHHQAALCFVVVQRFRSEYQWPEPEFPKLDAPPNAYVSDCIPWVPEEPHSYKRETSEAKQAARLYWKEFLLFSDTARTDGGFNPKSRYITAYYVNNVCNMVGSYVSFDRHFVSQLERTSESFGMFRWKRQYTDIFVIGGAPKKLSAVNEQLQKGYYQVEWHQPFSAENGQFRPGVLAHALLGLPHPQNPNSGKSYQLCDVVPEAWKTCQGNTVGRDQSGCAFQSDSKQVDNAPGTWMWPTSKESDPATLKNALGVLQCEPAFTRCPTDYEETWLAFQNYGKAARDFSKLPTSHLLTGPRSQFCRKIVNVLFDTLKFKPYTVGSMQIRKRSLAAPLRYQNNDFTFKRGTTIATVMEDPIAEALPTLTDVKLQPAAGSSDPDGGVSGYGGDHPVALFPETYTGPMSVRDDDRSCGQYGTGSFDTTGCEARVFDGAPPCVEGSLGCSCRVSQTRDPCDPPLECNNDNFCVKETCPKGESGCECLNGACGQGLACNGGDGRCYAEDSCTAGSAGCNCDANGGCSSGSVCVSGVCARVGGCEGAAGAPGCACIEAANGGGSCNGADYMCEPNLGMCVTAGFCESGAGGCQCAKGKRCAAGFECNAAVNKCSVPKCEEGTKGCPCKNGQCTDDGYLCTKLTIDGSESACLAKIECGDQTERCNNYCGEYNTLHCPQCEHQRPMCIHDVSAASTGTTVSMLVLIMAALVALFF